MRLPNLLATILIVLFSGDSSGTEPPGRALPLPAHGASRAHVCPKRSVELSPETMQFDVRKDLDDGDFDLLEQKLSTFRTNYAQSECSDRPFNLIFLALMDGAPALQRRYDEWVAKKPKSPFALTARGDHYLIRADYSRGQEWASDTSAARFAAMDRFLTRAEADFNSALALDPTFAEAMDGILNAKTLGSDIGARQAAYDRFVTVAPHSYVLDTSMIDALAPQWGGSVSAQLQFAQKKSATSSAYTDENLLVSRAQCLAAEELAIHGDMPAALVSLHNGMSTAGTMDAYCYFAKGMVSREANDYDQAAAAFAQFRQWEGPVYFVSKEAGSLLHVHQYGAAIVLYSLGIKFRSASPTLFCGRAQSELGLGQLQQARRDVEAGLATDPAEPYCLRVQQRIIKQAQN